MRPLSLLVAACALAILAAAPQPSAPSIEKGPPQALLRNPAFPEPDAPPSEAINPGRTFTAADFVPYFTGGKAAEAKQEFAKRNFLKTRMLLAREGNAGPIRYLRALSAFRADDFAHAAQEMASLANDYPALRDRCLIHAALSEEQMRHWAAAAQLFGQVQETSKLYVDARLGLVRALHRKGDLQSAVEAVASVAGIAAPAWGRDVGAEGLIALADLWGELKNPSAEREALRVLWSTHPLSPLSAQAERRLKGTSIPVEASVTRAESLIEAHRNRQGLAVLEPLLDKLSLPDPLACRARFAYGKALRKERRHSSAATALKQVAEKCKDPELRPKVLFVLGSSQAMVDAKEGASTYEALARESPRHPFADDSLFYAADLHLKNGEPKVALKLLSELSEKYPTGDFLGEALFRLFWIYRQDNQTREALQVLDRIEQAFAPANDRYEIGRARYWRGRTLELLERPKEAAEVFAANATEYPGSYYGLMARARWEKLDPDGFLRAASDLKVPDQAAEPWPLYGGAMGDDPRFQSGLELMRLGFPDAAAAEFLTINRAGHSTSALRLLVHAVAACGEVRAAHAIARTSLRIDLAGRVTRENRALWEMAYPNSFRSSVEKHSASVGLDPDLLEALMREESSLDPRALSPAGALGLTQLMLPTAKDIGRRLKIPNVTAELLLQPEPNIQIGAKYLSNLLKQFDGEMAYALASYNAGPLSVIRWRQALPKAEMDEWIEQIPLSETRGYVKRVLRSYGIYRLLYARRGIADDILLSGFR
jgi:soluble lytic murein transglycosylase